MTAGNDASLHNGPGDAPGPGPELTVIVDGANVVGSRPDGWWRDRAGAAVRLHDELAKLAVRGAAGIAPELLATGGGDEPSGSPDAIRDASRAFGEPAEPGAIRRSRVHFDDLVIGQHPNARPRQATQGSRDWRA